LFSRSATGQGFVHLLHFFTICVQQMHIEKFFTQVAGVVCNIIGAITKQLILRKEQFFNDLFPMGDASLPSLDRGLANPRK